uniref:non-specific serine/threonine protein kinase n=1 Tax=Aegilops tauschii subsp. strangulata TaxID=200361 RepID=A0A453Q4I8_AEGTS
MVVNATSIEDCKQACLENCSCMAVLFTARECVWVTKVFSLRSIQSEVVGYNSPAYLKVQLSPSNENKKKVHLNPSSENKKVILGATVGAVTTFVLLVIIVTLFLRRRKYEEKDEFDFDQLPGMLTRFSFEKLSECTEGFSKKLGDGGFGSVFQGELGEEKVAVKRLEGARQGKKEFLAEVETIGSIEHINLVRLIGFCAEKSERLLVYEYMSRGSLDRWIYYRHNNAPLDWCTRSRIILDIAKGLCYLHEECRHIIAHLDIKPQNILLDDNFNAKVADFGLCKLINRDQSKVVTMMRGTPGYLAPEWLTSRITEKVDVYSFGVVLMEIVSGRKNIDNSQPEEDVQLINLLREKAQNNHLIDLIDRHVEDMVSHQEEVIQMMKLAIWCLQHDSILRPSMSTVIKALEGAISIETLDTNSVMPVQDNPSTYSVTSQASMLSGPR